MSYIFEKTQVLAADSASTDAAGRWRVSECTSLFQGVSGYSEDLLWSDQLISGTLVSSQSTPLAATIFTTTANTAGRRIRQSLKRFPHYIGSSQRITCTFVANASVGGNAKRVGAFDDRNGLFFQQDGSEISFIRRTYTSGSAVDNKVLQSAWTIDSLDGTGPSGITIDFTKIQTLIIDFEWPGRARIGFIIDGQVHYCHEFLSENVLTSVPTSTPALPIRFEMEHSGTGGSSSLRCIAASSSVEDGNVKSGSPGGRWSALQSLSATTGYGLLGLRLKAAQVHTPVVFIDNLTFICSTAGDVFAWYLLRDPSLSGTFTYGGISNTSIEVAAGSPTATLSGADIITMGVGYGENQIEVPLSSYNIQLETEADGTAIPLVLAVYANTALSAAAAVRWRQLG